MKRTTNILMLLCICLYTMADTYTIVFKDSGTGSDKTSKMTSTSPEDYISQGEDLVGSVSSTNCYLAKSGYGLKFGTTSSAGSIVLTLQDTYKPSKITITAAAYAGKDSVTTKSFKLGSVTQNFSGGTALTDYVFTFDGKTDVSAISISANAASYNRYYVSKVVIEAPDPAPFRGEIIGPKKADLGFEHLSNGIVETMTELEFTTRNIASNISLSIADTTRSFSVVRRSIAREGGIVQVSFSSKKKGKYSAVLTLSTIGMDENQVIKQVPVSITVCSEIFHSGEADDPYTVADALSRMEELADNETSKDWWYIRGYVASDSIATSSSTGGLTFNLAWDSDTIYVYAMTGQNGSLISADQIHKGDTLLIRSRLQNYVGYKESHKEVYMGELIDEDIPAIDWRLLQEGYYDDIQFTSDTTLKRILGEIISGGIRYTYGSGSSHTWDAFFHTDREEGSMLVLDMYSDNQRYFSPENPTASVGDLDIEHMFPKSWWGGYVNNAYKDLYHLVPADYSANRSKGNDAPGQVLTPSFDNGSFKIGTPAESCPAPRVFEPADQYKGDFARAYFYILTAYADFDWDLTTPATYALDPSSPLLLQPWLQQVLLQWHRQDPVSEKEIRRIAEVSKIQHNRNPFIDYPCLVEYIWGSKQDLQVDLSKLLFTSSDEYQTTSDKSGCTCQCIETTIDEIEEKAETLPLERPRLIMHEGTLRILYNGKTYSITGLVVE